MAAQVARAPLPFGWLAGYLGMTRSPSALAELDGLRAIAILLVLARHAVRPFHDETNPLLPIGGWDAAVPMLNGWIGVDLFFVLSGFLISGHLLRHHERPGGLALGPYLGKRALRIVPAYYAVLGLVAAGLVPMYALSPHELPARMAYHAVFLQDYLPSNIVVAFWSLGVEEKFYLLAPLALAAILFWREPRLQLAMVVVLITIGPVARAVAAAAYPDIDGYVEFFYTLRSPFHACIDALMIGVLCALVLHHRERLAWLRRPSFAIAILWSGVALAGWLLLVTPLLGHIGWFEKVLQPLLIATAAGSVVAGIVLSRCAVPFLRSLAMLVIARLSYCLYLVHMPLIPGLIWLLDGPLGLAAAPASLRFAAFVPIFATASLASAAALHYLIEKPFLLLKDRL